jgi:hypothetical protein
LARFKTVSLKNFPQKKFRLKRLYMLALFGFFMAVAYDAPMWVFFVGFICLIGDAHGNV